MLDGIYGELSCLALHTMLLLHRALKVELCLNYSKERHQISCGKKAWNFILFINLLF